jgi:hypothetical protein
MAVMEPPVEAILPDCSARGDRAVMVQRLSVLLVVSVHIGSPTAAL